MENKKEEKKLCKCGCGESLKKRKDGTYGEFINYHYSRYNNPMKGQKHSKEACEKMSTSGKGKRKSEEHKRKIGEGNKGKIMSQEAREKLSKAHTGKKLSEEHKRKIGESGKGKTLGRKHSEETKKKDVSIC